MFDVRLLPQEHALDLSQTMKLLSLVMLIVALAKPATATDPLAPAVRADRGSNKVDLLTESINAAGNRQLQAQIHAKFNRVCGQLPQYVNKGATDEELARTILTFMHNEILTGVYDAELFSVGQTLAEGNYNCLTATILYCCLCKTVKLDVAIISVPGHVFVRLRDSSSHAIETTCSRWIPTQPNSAIEREISETQLVARIYYNRGVYHAQRHQYQAAIAALESSIHLDSHHLAAIRNRAVAFNNWSLDLCKQERYEDASQLIRRAYSVSPCPEFVATAEFVYSQWMNDKFAHGQIERTTAMLDDAMRFFPSSTVFKKLRENLAADLTIPRF